jgi:2-oxoglutarate ferredoxin oxidoreductase subunit delta
MFGKLKKAQGVVVINKAWCKGCGYCVQYCPTKVLEISKDYNQKGYHPPVVTSADDCRNCKFCEIVCPEFAIFVKADDDEEQISA